MSATIAKPNLRKSRHKKALLDWKSKGLLLNKSEESMTDLIFKLNPKNCEFDLPEITFFDDESDDSIILKVELEKQNGIIQELTVTKAEYWHEADHTREPIEIDRDMVIAAEQAIMKYDPTAFTEYEPPIKDYHSYYGVSHLQFS